MIEESNRNLGQKQTFWQLISNENSKKIKIPMIQRDYVQGRDTPQVEDARKTLLQDFAFSLKNEKPMDLNFVYGNIEGEYFIPIDGQQRLTTLFLLHVYAFAQDDSMQENLKKLKDHFLYETRITTERFFASLAKNLPSFFKEKNYPDIESYISDAAWFSDSWKEDPSIFSAIVVLNEIQENFSDIKELSQKLIKEDCPITFMALQISDMGKANDLYIKMNSRGKILSYFESFKAELFYFMDNLDCHSWPHFKQYMDNEWQNLIWEGCQKNDINAFKRCDDIMLYLIHWIVLNRVVPNKDNYDEIKIDNLVNNDGFYIFKNYEEFLNDVILINDIYQLFEFLKFLKENASTYYTLLIKWLIEVVPKPEWSERVILFAITKYAVMEGNWQIPTFLAYVRIANNLIQNTIIDKENLYISACCSINHFNPSVFSQAESYFASMKEITSSNVNFFFTNEQLKEERYKCLLITSDANWKEVIVRAEQNNYFKGKIAFALKLAGADLEDFSTVNEVKIEDFQKVWDIILTLFDDKGLKIDDDLFRRAFLTFGDYSILANSSYTFFFESGKRYFDWRRMLREEDSFSVFEKFFCEMKKIVERGEILSDKLKDMIEQFDDESDEFIFYLVKYPELFSYMTEYRYKKCNSSEEKHRIILYSKARLSAEYAEFHTYLLYKIFENSTSYSYGHGYLDDKASYAHINRIGKMDCHMEYDGKFVDENGEPLMNDNQEVVTIKDGIKYIKTLLAIQEQN